MEVEGEYQFERCLSGSNHQPSVLAVNLGGNLNWNLRFPSAPARWSRRWRWGAEKGRTILPPGPRGSCEIKLVFYLVASMVTVTGLEGMPLVTTTNSLSPNSMLAGTSNLVVTISEPVATPIEL